MSNIDVFISHSSSDANLALALIGLLRASLNLPASKIRCTSVDGFRLPVGASTDARLRQEVSDSKAFVGLLTQSSIKSVYVMFELGARWGANMHLAPLLAGGVTPTILQGPISGLNALSCDNEAQLHQLVADLAQTLGVICEPPASYIQQLKAVMEASSVVSRIASPLIAIFDEIMIGSRVDPTNGKEASFFFIPLSIVNRSAAPISPDWFSLSVKIEDSWYEFKNTLIPEDAVWNSEKQEIEVPDAASRDLLKLGASVSAGQAISGHLMFISSDVPLSAISNSKPHDFKMNVTDVLGTTFEVAIAPPRPGSIGPARRLNVYASNKAKSGP